MNIPLNSKISIYGIKGNKIYDFLSNGSSAKLDVSSLRKGSYIIMLNEMVLGKITK